MGGIANPLEKSSAGRLFIGFTFVHSVFVLANDVGLQLNKLGYGDAVMLQVLDAYALAFMAASALTWSSGAMELFFSSLQTAPQNCGCYYRMADLPSALALVLPLNLVIRLKTKVVDTMRAAIMEGGFLCTVRHTLPYDFVRAAHVDVYGSLIGYRGLGHAVPRGKVELPPRGLIDIRIAKHAAKTLCWSALLIVLMPLLLSSSFLTYRVLDLLLSVLKPMLKDRFVVLSGNLAALGLLGIYGMIFSQALAVMFFITSTWRLYFILAIQFKDKDVAAPHVVKLVSTQFPELRWAFK